jgi:hypothetical protein
VSDLLAGVPVMKATPEKDALYCVQCKNRTVGVLTKRGIRIPVCAICWRPRRYKKSAEVLQYLHTCPGCGGYKSASGKRCRMCSAEAMKCRKT